MPVWHILHPDNVFTDPREKALLAKDITALYTAAGLPPFYVNVFYQKFAPGDSWTDSRYQGDIDGLRDGDVQGVTKRERPFVRFEIDQIAVHIQDEERTRLWCEKIDAVSAPVPRKAPGLLRGPLWC